MRIKRTLWSFAINTLSKIYCLVKPKTVVNLDIVGSAHIDLITVAFNNEVIVEHQIRLVKKYCTDSSYTHIIADNSSSREKRKKIFDVCKKYSVAYISMPYNLARMLAMLNRPSSSYSHGFALNWLYYNVVKVRQPYIFGFLDHDLFPLKPFSVADKLQRQELYGERRDRQTAWYLWAGFCFFLLDAVKSISLNFAPTKVGGVYLDTGGANYQLLYKRYNMEQLQFPTKRVAMLRENAGSEKESYYSNQMYYLDGDTWLHTINGGYHTKVAAKEKFLEALLGQY